MIDHEKTEKAAHVILEYSVYVLVVFGILQCLESLLGVLLLFLPLGSLMYLKGREHNMF